MRINFVVNPIAINNGWSPWDIRLGGSEESVREWSWRLKHRGHEVAVYHNGRHGVFKGVEYKDRRSYLDDAGPGLTINVNYPDLRPLEPTVYWSTLDTQGGWDLSPYEAIVGISQYQLDHCGLQHERALIIPPGYEPATIYPGHKVPRSVLYCSSPDRGLKNLLNVWPNVLENVSDAQLIITYGGQTDLPNTLCLGDVDEETMNELYQTSDIWCHPANGGELYCMAGIKAQAAGCIPIYYPTMALAETVKDGLWASPDTLEHCLVRALTDTDTTRLIRRNLSHQTFPTWESTTDQWEKLLANL